MKICPTCQQTYSDEVEFCPRDGARLAAQATETEAQLAGQLSRRFRIVRRLGAGGMGAVFLAEQIGVGNRPVALKVLSRKLLDDPDFLLRFQDEAASTGRIHHPNVVTIYESGQADDGTPYIAMEYLEGESLREALKRRGALPVPEVAEILQQAARGLNAAHKLGIIHRDLKPDNIFLTYPDDVGAGLVPALPVGIADTGRPQEPPLPPVVVKLVDFGIAKLRGSGAHTQTGMVLGTPAYMSFEQASGMRSDELDARSDIYSLGVVVYEMLTGRTPFHSDTPVGYLRMHMQEDPPPFRTVKPDLPALPQLESVAMKALTKDRNQRYSSVLEFADEFTHAANGMGFEATRRPVPRPTRLPLASFPEHSLAAPLSEIWADAKVDNPQPTQPHMPATVSIGVANSQRGAKYWAAALVASAAIVAASMSIAITIWHRQSALPKPSTVPDAAHVDKGSALASEGDWGGAIGEYRQALRLNPNNENAHLGLGAALGKKGDSDGEIAEYREAIRLRPDDAKAHHQLGLALWTRKDYEGVITEERAALRLNPNDEEAHSSLGAARGEKRDWDGEIEEEREALRLDSNDARAHYCLAWALEQKHNNEEALKEYRAAYELHPKEAMFRQAYERLLHENKR